MTHRAVLGSKLFSGVMSRRVVGTKAGGVAKYAGALLGCLLIAATAHASDIASQAQAASLTFNISNSLGDNTRINVDLIQTGTMYGEAVYGTLFPVTTTLASGAQITFSDIEVGDPVQTFSATINFGPALTVPTQGWIIGTDQPPPALPGLPFSGPYTWFTQVNGTYADGSSPKNGGQIDPCNGSAFCGGLGSTTVAQFRINSGVPDPLLVGSSVGGTQAFAAISGTQAYGGVGLFSASGTGTCPAGGCTQMGTGIAFIVGLPGNGVGDSATITSYFEIQPIPPTPTPTNTPTDTPTNTPTNTPTPTPTPPVPTNKEQCKNGGWQLLFKANGQRIKNQGDCVSYVNTGK